MDPPPLELKLLDSLEYVKKQNEIENIDVLNIPLTITNNIETNDDSHDKGQTTLEL